MDTSNRAAIMKRDVVGRVSYTEAQRETLLDEFEHSGLKGAQFARAVGVKYQTFAHWVQQRRHLRGEYEARNGKTGLRWVEAVVTASAISAGESADVAMQAEVLTVQLQGGVRLLVASPRQASLAAHLIQALNLPC
jgi:hypothetical protein